MKRTRLESFQSSSGLATGKGLPFGKLLAAPKDGKPVSRWSDLDEAYLDVVVAIKNALKELGQKATPIRPAGMPSAAWAEAVKDTLAGPRSSNLRVKKEFTELDRDRFRQEGFEFMARFFENSMEELVARHPGVNLEPRFQRVDANHFTAAVYKNGRKVCKGAASIGDGIMGKNTIQYLMDDTPRSGGMNEAVSVQADDQMLYFEALGMQSYAQTKEKLSPQGAAELFWGLFVQPLQ